MSDEFSIHLKIDLKRITSNLESLKSLLEDSATSADTTHSYFTYETDGQNNQIYKNDLIYIAEFSQLENIELYIEFINSIREVEIQLVCRQDRIIYMNREYKKTLDRQQQREIIERIQQLQQSNNELTRLYRLLIIK